MPDRRNFLSFALAMFTSSTLPAASESAAPQFLNWAPTPPMGWNSWDCFATTVTEEQTKAQADFMAAKLKAHGWQYIVVDIQWSKDSAKVKKDSAGKTSALHALASAVFEYALPTDALRFKATAGIDAKAGAGTHGHVASSLSSAPPPARTTAPACPSQSTSPNLAAPPTYVSATSGPEPTSASTKAVLPPSCPITEPNSTA